MMTGIKRLAAVFAAFSALVSCVSEAEDPDTVSNAREWAFIASLDGNDSRTLVKEDNKIWWSPSDSIRIFYGSQASGKFRSSNDNAVAVTKFTGTFDSAIGGIETGQNPLSFWGVYPYSEESVCDDASVTLRFPTEQEAVEGSFAPGAFPTVAKSDNLSLSFWIVGGGVRFTVERTGIRRAVFRSADGSPVSGVARVSFDDYGLPVVTDVSAPVDSVVVLAPKSGFVPGKAYFATMLPVTHKSGMRISVKTAITRGNGLLAKEISVRRAVFGRLDKIDSALEYVSDMTGVVEVSDTTALRAALVDAAPKILLHYSEEPYMLKSVKLAGPVALFGEETLEGEKPVFQGDFQVDPTVVSSLHFENLEFDGMDYKYHMVTILKAGTMSEITALNCDIHSYSRGILYDNYGLNVPSVVYDHCLIHDIEGNGGDCFDFRKARSIGSVKFSNSSIYDGMRTFIRIDANPKLESLEISHCTFSNLLYRVDVNTNGLIHVRAKNAAGADPSIILRSNLFLNMRYGDQAAATKRATLIGTNSADKLPTEISKNWYYNCDDAFFMHTVSGAETLGLDKCVAGGGALLGDDPCMDSEGGNFYVSSTAVLAAQAGDPRWLQPYVPVPEDLTLPVTEPVKTWNLTDTKTFGKEVKTDMVRDGIRFYVKDNTVTVGASGFIFDAAAALSAGVPSDGGLGILVDRPGGLVVSTLSNDNDQAFIAVSLGGKVKAGIPVGATNNMVVLDDIEEGAETMIYIYPTAPVILSGLQWTDDIDTGGPKVLDAPVLAIDKTSVAQGETETVTVSWEAVAKAGSYDVTFNGASTNVTATSYAIATKNLEAGDYTVSVVAKPAADDFVREASAVSEISFSVKEVLKKVSAVSPTVWGLEYMTAGVEKFGNGTGLMESFVYGNLGYVTGGSKFKFGIDNADTDPKYRVQLGGTGTAGVKSCVQFIAGGSGVLTIVARSAGDAARPLAVAIGSADVAQQDAPGKAQKPAELTYTVNSVAGELINIYSKKSGINLYSITWTPMGGGDVPGGDVEDPDAINEEYNADFSDAAKFPAGAFEEAKVIDKVTYCGASGAAIEFDPAGQRIRYKGKSTLGEDGIPTARYASFKITKPGVITHKMVSGSSTATDRKGAVILVTTTTEGKKVTVLWNDFTPTSSAADALTYTVTADQLAGITESALVYFYAEANINLYALGFKPES